MEKWTVTIFGHEFDVMARSRYAAKKEGAKCFNSTTGNNIALSSLASLARIRKHNDNRIKYTSKPVQDPDLEEEEQ